MTIEQQTRGALEETAREVACEKVGNCFTQGTDVLVIARAVKAAKYSFLAAAEPREKEIAELRARLAELETRAAKWVEIRESSALRVQGWMQASSYSPRPTRMLTHVLMVPPIPLPEGEGSEPNSENPDR